ncbi:MAG: GDSL-type esterase/lipase family protein [Planctomycetota bacterium]|nr:GDSL-type esterase/lipase family protein [Planctomycetota bacterium]
MRTLLALVIALALGTALWAEEADAWVEPMKAVRAKFTGQAGTVAQFGDSITITMAFFVPLQERVKNLPDNLQEAHAWARKYVQNRCWRGWKGPEFGNEGRTTTEWALQNMDGWLKKLNPEVALVMWGTNDTYLGPKPPKYTDNLRAIVQKCLDNGTIPILYTIPPKGDQAGNPQATKHVETFVEAARTVAEEKKVPLIDFYKEIMTRQPTDFAKTLLGDGLHPSYPPQYQNDFSEEGLKNSGYTLRNYLSLKKYHEVYQKALSKAQSARSASAEAAWKGPKYKGRPAVLIPKAAKAPTVDGKLDDECWQQAPSLPFRLLDGSTAQPKQQTSAKLVTAGDTLYVVFHCAEPEPGKLVSSKRDRDSNIWEDDSVEFFLRPGPEPAKDYHHLIVNPAGSFLDAVGDDPQAWQSELKLAAATGKDYWSVEIAVPLAELYQPGDKDKLSGAWRLNLTRMRPLRDDQPAEETALSPTEDPSSHVPEMFAYVFFETFGGKIPQE